VEEPFVSKLMATEQHTLLCLLFIGNLLRHYLLLYACDILLKLKYIRNEKITECSALFLKCCYNKSELKFT